MIALIEFGERFLSFNNKRIPNANLMRLQHQTFDKQHKHTHMNTFKMTHRDFISFLPSTIDAHKNRHPQSTENNRGKKVAQRCAYIISFCVDLYFHPTSIESVHVPHICIC